MFSFYIFIAIIFLLLFLLINIFNKFAKNRNVVKDAWSNIDVALKLRHDLIPNLINTVKGYAAHEQETLTRVVEARNNALSAPKDNINAQIIAENQLQQGLRSLFAIAESYPNLKADTSFLNLQSQLSKVEENLERSRRYFNSAVRENNTYGETFPAVVFAGMFKYEKFNYFEATEADRENVKVDFSK
ncbi:MAG TPA: LemA family protein [Edaphocola sp.]|nr:LemA family protein [Edaphocola sp.]